MTVIRAFHLYYHGDRDALLLELVRPLVERLEAADLSSRFFFIRYGLGGPHVRLRLETTAEIHEIVEEAAADFFARRPSTAPRPADELQRTTERLLRQEPGESDATLYPDNSVRAAPFVPEIERYGGAELFSASLDYFDASSRAALDFLADNAAEPPARRLPLALRELLHQAWGLARDEEEWRALVRHPAASVQEPLRPIVERADAVFEANDAAYHRLVEGIRHELDRLEDDAENLPPILDAGRRLHRATAAAPDRGRLLTSQLHMSANRLGLKYSDEIYLSRLAERALEALPAVPPPAGEEQSQSTRRLS